MNINLISDPYVLENLFRVFNGFIIAFLIALLLTPFAGYLAKKLNIVDLGVDLRKKSDAIINSRNHTGVKYRLGGLALAFAIFFALVFTGRLTNLGFGIPVAMLVIIFIGFLEDKYEIPGSLQLLGQLVAAIIVVVSGLSVTSISLLGTTINFDWFTLVLQISEFQYVMNLPADILTIIWIVGVINVVNWVGGVDGLNISITSIIAFTIMVIALSSSNVVLAVIIAIFIGANLGVLPYNYNPSYIFLGGIGDYLNGFMLAIFAILAGTTWNSTLLLLGLPIIDAIIVVYLRFKSNPILKKDPLKIFSISDQNHLQHRLLAVGYSRKMVVLIEVAIMVCISSIALFFTSLRESRTELIFLAFGFSFILVVFTYINFKKQKALQVKQRSMLLERDFVKPEVKVVVSEDDEDDYERYIY